MGSTRHKSNHKTKENRLKSSEWTYRTVPEKRTGSCVMMESRERSCSKPTCDTSMPSMSMRPPHFSVRRNSAATNDDLPVASQTTSKHAFTVINKQPIGCDTQLAGHLYKARATRLVIVGRYFVG